MAVPGSRDLFRGKDVRAAPCSSRWRTAS